MFFLARVAQFKAQLFIVGLLLAAAAVFLSPYIAQRNIERYSTANNLRALDTYIDLGAVQDHTSTWLQGQLGELTPIIGSGGGLGNIINLGGAVQFLGSAFIRAQVAQSFNMPMVSQGIEQIVRSDPSANRLVHDNGVFTLPHLPDQYRDFTHFEFWSTDDRISAHVVMCRQYLVEWKICGIEGKDIIAELGDSLQKYFSKAARR